MRWRRRRLYRNLAPRVVAGRNVRVIALGIVTIIPVLRWLTDISGLGRRDDRRRGCIHNWRRCVNHWRGCVIPRCWHDRHAEAEADDDTGRCRQGCEGKTQPNRTSVQQIPRLPNISLKAHVSSSKPNRHAAMTDETQTYSTGGHVSISPLIIRTIGRSSFAPCQFRRELASSVGAIVFGRKR